MGPLFLGFREGGGTAGFRCLGRMSQSCTNGVSGDVSNHLNNVQAISATENFRSIKNDGTVVSWGDITMKLDWNIRLKNMRVVFGKTVLLCKRPQRLLSVSE